MAKIKGSGTTAIDDENALVDPSSALTDNTAQLIETVKRDVEILLENQQRIDAIKKASLIKRDEVVRNLFILQDKQDEVKEITGKNFDEFIEEDLGISKGYFYEQTRTYLFCKETGFMEAFNNTPLRMLQKIKQLPRKEQKRLLKKAESGSLEPIDIEKTDFFKTKTVDKFARQYARMEHQLNELGVDIEEFIALKNKYLED